MDGSSGLSNQALAGVDQRSLIFCRSLERAARPVSDTYFWSPGFGEGEPDIGIALDVLVLVAVRIGQEIDRVLVPVDIRRHRPRVDVLAVKRAEHAEADLLDQRPDTVGVAVIG